MITEATTTDTGLDNGIGYSYQVSAVNTLGEGPRSAMLIAFTLPAAPENFTVDSVSFMLDPADNTAVIGSATLSWDTVRSATSYTIYRGATATNLAVHMAGETGLTYTDDTLIGEHTYFYWR